LGLSLQYFISLGDRLKLNTSRRYILYISLTIIVLLFNLLLAQRYFSSSESLSPDQTYYYDTAKAILNGSSVVETSSGTEDIGWRMAPGFSYLLVFLFSIFGKGVANAYYMNIIFHVLATLCLFYILSRTTNTFVAFIFSLWLTFYFPVWRLNFMVMMETPTIFLLALSFLLLYKFIDSRRMHFLLLFSLSSGYLIFLNNRFIFHFSIFALLLIIFAFKKYIFRWKHVAVFVGVIILVLLPWHIRQMRTYDTLVLFSPRRTASMLPEGIAPEVAEDVDIGFARHSVIKPYQEYYQSFSKITGWSKSRVRSAEKAFTREKYTRMVEDYRSFYSKPYAKYLSRLSGFWNIWRFDFHFNYGGDTRLLPPNRPIVNLIDMVFLIPVFLLFPVGLIFGLVRKDLIIQTLSLFVLSHWILHAFVHYIPRYRKTVLPFIFMVAFYGIYQVGRLIIHKTLEGRPEEY